MRGAVFDDQKRLLIVCEAEDGARWTF